MSDNIPERRAGSETSAAEFPSSAAYGARVSSSAEALDTTPATRRTFSTPAGPFYAPVHRYARSSDEPRRQAPAGAASFPDPARTVDPWPPAATSGTVPAGRRPVGLPPAGWGPPPPWGSAGSWTPPRRDDYATWGRRVAGATIDAAPGWVASTVLYAGYLPLYVGLFRGELDAQPRYALVLVGMVLCLGAFGWAVYNNYFLAGRTGQSMGKRVMKTWLVSQTTGRPIGAYNAFLRSLLHVVDGLGYVGYLWPLWDDDRQTLADKLAQTVVVRTPAPPLTDLERRRP